MAKTAATVQPPISAAGAPYLVALLAAMEEMPSWLPVEAELVAALANLIAAMVPVVLLLAVEVALLLVLSALLALAPAEVGAKCCHDEEDLQADEDHRGRALPLPACVERNDPETEILNLNQFPNINHSDFHNHSLASSSSSSSSSSR